MDTADLQIHEMIKDIKELIQNVWTTEDVVIFLKGYLTEQENS